MTFKIKNKYILTITTLLFLFLCNNLTSQTLTVKFQNNTGHKIDSLIVGTTYIGTIEKDSITGLIQFAKFRFDSGFPNEFVFGVIGENRLKSELIGRCGTSLAFKEKGNFFFKLVIREGGDKEYLLLE